MLTTEYANLALFLAGVFWDSNTNPYTPIQYFVDSHQFGSTQTFLELAAYSRALEVALPRLMMEGILNTPSSFDIPLLLKKSSVYYWVNTFEWDLRNDEIKVEAISLPAASFTTTSEYIEPAMIPPSEGSGSSSSGSASSGTSLEEVQAWVNSQGFLTGITSQQVINALGYTPVSVFDARLLSLVGAPTIVRRKGWRNATAGNETFFDVMEVSHPLLGVSGFEMVLMAYRKRNSRKVTSGYQGAWKNKKGWAVAAGNYDVCGFVPFTSVSGKFNVQDLRTYILKRFVRIDGQTAVDIFTNMTASALDNTYGSTPKAFYGYSGHMRLGFAIRRVNPAFEAATYGQTNLKDTFQCVYSSITGKYEPRYLYSAIAPMTAFLRTYGNGKVRNILDFSLIPQG